MKVLLDTHALLWWITDDPALGAAARAIVADPANDILVSVASLWEIVVKLRIGKLKADIGMIINSIDADGFRQIGITPVHLSILSGLALHHRDPFDHLLIAQSIAEDAVLLTNDRRADLYPGARLRC